MQMNFNGAIVNNKLAFFDFDRTLVAHKYSSSYTKAREDSYLMDCVYGLLHLDDEHANDRPLPCMQWYAKKLAKEGYGLYCLTHEIFNLRDKLKQDQLKEFYSDTPMTYLTVDTPDHKVDMMMAVSMVECCDLKDVIFVDDRMDTINQAVAAGIDAKHLSDIVVMYESEHNPQEQGTELKKTGEPEDLEDMYEDEPEEPCETDEYDLSEKELERIVREHRKERLENEQKLSLA